MKYIRTKDGIYKVWNWWNNSGSIPESDIRITGCYVGNGKNINIEDISQQADTIEELCDGFVVISEEYDEPHYVKKLIDTNALDFRNNWKPYGNGKVLDQTCQKLLDAIIYGAIWTKKGLIYVAKMNEKGDIELL